MNLAQIAYSDLPQPNRERYTFDAFMQSINDLGLHHHFLARGVTTVEGALREGDAYLLANQMNRNHEVSRQVEAELATTHDDTGAATSTTAAARQLATASKVAQLTDMLAKLVAAFTPTPMEDNARRRLRPLARPPRERAKIC